MSACEIKVPSAHGLPEQELTVGRVFELSCSGLVVPEGTSAEKINFVLGESSQYAIKNLQTLELTPTTIRLKSTAYRVGDWKFPELKISDGSHEVILGPLNFSVQTVIQKDENQAPPEPFGPMGPLGISIPWFYYAFFFAILIAVMGQVVFYFRRRWQRQTLLERSGTHFLTGNALHQFHYYSRQWQRKYGFFNDQESSAEEVKTCLEEIDFQLKIYLVRSFKIPALDWSAPAIVKELKKSHPLIHDEFGPGLKKNLIEIQKLKSKVNSVQGKDIVQIHEHARQWIEKVDRCLAKELGAR